MVDGILRYQDMPRYGEALCSLSSKHIMMRDSEDNILFFRPMFLQSDDTFTYPMSHNYLLYHLHTKPDVKYSKFYKYDGLDPYMLGIWRFDRDSNITEYRPSEHPVSHPLPWSHILEKGLKIEVYYDMTRREYKKYLYKIFLLSQKESYPVHHEIIKTHIIPIVITR